MPKKKTLAPALRPGLGRLDAQVIGSTVPTIAVQVRHEAALRRSRHQATEQHPSVPYAGLEAKVCVEIHKRSTTVLRAKAPLQSQLVTIAHTARP